MHGIREALAPALMAVASQNPLRIGVCLVATAMGRMVHTNVVAAALIWCGLLWVRYSQVPR